MTIRLEGTIKRYLGESTDTKPQSGEPYGRDATIETIPVGSSFLETDTGRIYRWDGEGWVAYIPSDAQAFYLRAILLELQQLNRQLELATGVLVS